MIQNKPIQYQINFKSQQSDQIFKKVTIWTYTGELHSKINYKDGSRDGLFEEYYENGQLKMKGNFKDGSRDGLFEMYDENGQLKFNYNFKDNRLINN